MICSQKFFFLICTLLLAQGVFAQTTSTAQEPEVRRAIPLSSTSSQPEKLLQEEISHQNRTVKYHDALRKLYYEHSSEKDCKKIFRLVKTKIKNRY